MEKVFFFRGDKEVIISELNKIKSLLYKTNQPTQQLNIEEVETKLKLLGEYKNPIVGSMLLVLVFNDIDEMI